MGLKELILGLTKSVEKLSEDVKESSMSKRQEESCGSDGSGLKMKGKMEEANMMSGFMGGVLDRNKYKKLEMPIFAG